MFWSRFEQITKGMSLSELKVHYRGPRSTPLSNTMIYDLKELLHMIMKVKNEKVLVDKTPHIKELLRPSKASK